MEIVMINMIRADLYKMIRSAGFYIALALMIALIAASVYLAEPGNIGIHMSISVGGETGNDISIGGETDSQQAAMTSEEMRSLSVSELRRIRLENPNYKLDRYIMGSNINLYYVFLFAVVIVVTADFSGSCVKNTLSSAISRKQYFLSKTVFTMACCLILFCLNTCILYFSNRIFNGENVSSRLGEIALISLRQIPPVIAIAGILTGAAFLLKRTAAFNTAMIPFVMVVQLLLSFLHQILRFPDSFMDYEFQTMLLKLAEEPADGYILKSCLFCAGVTIAALLVGWFSFRKAEIR